MSVIGAFRTAWFLSEQINIDLMNNEWLIFSFLGNITITRVMTRTSTINSRCIMIKTNHKPKATTPVSSSTTISRLQIKISKFWIKS